VNIQKLTLAKMRCELFLLYGSHKEWYCKGQRNVLIDSVFETERELILFRRSLYVLFRIHIWLVLLG